MDLTRKMDYDAIIPGRVSGYRVIKGIPYNSSRVLDEGFEADGDAELLSNLVDLTAWTLDLQVGKYISRESMELAWQATRLNNDESIDASYLIYYDEQASYGMGWFLSELDGHRIVWTPGAGRGFSTTIMTLPDDDLSLVVLTNTRSFLIADLIAKDLARIVLDER
jgi:CubicO group peptidase (beta-lactamase class C family)